MMRYLSILGAAFALGAALAVGALRAWDLSCERFDNALRWGRA